MNKPNRGVEREQLVEAFAKDQLHRVIESLERRFGEQDDVAVAQPDLMLMRDG